MHLCKPTVAADPLCVCCGECAYESDAHFRSHNNSLRRVCTNKMEIIEFAIIKIEYDDDDDH